MEIETLKQARLVRQVPMRLVDVSLSGCLVETDRELGVGTTGLLLVDLWGVPCRYPIRVVRETEQLGSGHTLQQSANHDISEDLFLKHAIILL